MKIYSKKNNFILAGLMVLAVSCVKDNTPADCTKPATPTVPANSTVNEGDAIHLTASGVNGATYNWSGPHGFYSTSSDPVINVSTINNTGNYWVKAVVGYCYSDSVSTYVYVKSDSTCHLSDNVADFPTGPNGPFAVSSTSTINSNSNYQIKAQNSDSSLKILMIFKQKPTRGSAYNLVNSQNPGSNDVFYQITDVQGKLYYAVGNTALVKVSNTGKINVVVCQVDFPDLGQFSANVTGN